MGGPGHAEKRSFTRGARGGLNTYVAKRAASNYISMLSNQLIRLDSPTVFLGGGIRYTPSFFFKGFSLFVERVHMNTS